MAKVSAHGTTIGTVESLTVAKRYMGDGVILINKGFGWKRYGKVADGFTPQSAYDLAKSNLAAKLARMPCLAAYRAELHSMAGMGMRWKLHAAVSTMPDDCDGVWSEACDGYGGNVSASVDEVAHLCMLYKNALSEKQAELVG